MPIVSIIIPVYKAENYLRQCVESILNQTLSDFELILVDDGSPDGSGKLCDEFAANDVRIQVIHKDNGGVSSARNVALSRFQSKWLTFVDSDDCLYPDALEILVGQAEQNNLDLLQCHFNREYKEGESGPNVTEVLTSKQYALREQYLTCVGGTLFNASIVKAFSLRFDETVRLGEDQIFLLDYMQYCSRVQRIGDVLYYYRDNENSAVNNPRPEYEIASVKAFKTLKRNNPIAFKRCDAMLLSWFVSLVLTSDISAATLKELFEDVSLEYLSPKAQIAARLAYYLKKISIPFTVTVMRTLYKYRKLCQK